MNTSREAYRSKEWPGLTHTSSGQSNRYSYKEGIILVFDLDDTIAPYLPKNNNKSIFSLNPEMIQILKRAIEKKGNTSSTVSGIFLYTNNSDKKYIDFIHRLVSKEVGVLMNVFDDILWASPGIPNTRQKTLVDIELLCDKHDISTEDLANRVYFFDDQIHSDLFHNLPEGHYIQIKSSYNSKVINGYVPGMNSATNLSAVKTALGMEGGRKKVYKYKTKKNKRHRISSTRSKK